MEQLYESNFYICGMQHIPYLGATAIRNLIETYGGPFEAWCALQDRNKLKA
ncbi:MAG: DNA-protecting protein DprA, partial [Veillonella sp.]|nr:DNA-protecting protein DprA [Veillonella sp.]